MWQITVISCLGKASGPQVKYRKQKMAIQEIKKENVTFGLKEGKRQGRLEMQEKYFKFEQCCLKTRPVISTFEVFELPL